MNLSTGIIAVVLRMVFMNLTSLVMSSNTTRFSVGTRPIFDPDEQLSAPVVVIVVSPTVGSGDSICSGLRAYSYSSATLYKALVLQSLLPWVEHNVSVGDSECF